MNIRIAIVDDQAQTRELLRQDLLVRVPDGASIACFDGGEAFLSGFTPGDDALVFLDICMEGMNGIEVAQRVRKRSARCLIVFLTSSKEYAFDAFPIHPFDYLVKPYSAARLDHVLSGAISARWRRASSSSKSTCRAGRIPACRTGRLSPSPPTGNGAGHLHGFRRMPEKLADLRRIGGRPARGRATVRPATAACSSTWTRRSSSTATASC